MSSKWGMQKRSLIYGAEVTNSDCKVKNYVGQTTTTLKQRINEHKSNFINPKARHKTSLSSYLWNQRERGKDFDTKWCIKKQTSAYSPGDKDCRLCTEEIFYIIKNKSNNPINKKSEFFNRCDHKLLCKLDQLSVV